MKKDLVQIEIKLAYLEKFSDQLNEVVIEQQKVVDELRKKVDFLEKTLRSTIDTGIKDIDDETPPPHY